MNKKTREFIFYGVVLYFINSELHNDFNKLTGGNYSNGLLFITIVEFLFVLYLATQLVRTFHPKKPDKRMMKIRAGIDKEIKSIKENMKEQDYDPEKTDEVNKKIIALEWLKTYTKE